MYMCMNILFYFRITIKLNLKRFKRVLYVYTVNGEIYLYCFFYK